MKIKTRSFDELQHSLKNFHEVPQDFINELVRRYSLDVETAYLDGLNDEKGYDAVIITRKHRHYAGFLDEVQKAMGKDFREALESSIEESIDVARDVGYEQGYTSAFYARGD